MSEIRKILILGGTREAAKLAEKLVGDNHDVTTSLAGRTKEPLPIAGNTRTGGFSDAAIDGATGLANYLAENDFSLLIDATHPFATRISANAVKAAAICGIPLEVHLRPPWERQEGDNWTEVENLDEARDAIPGGATVLLALGSQHIAQFKDRDDVHFVVRMIDPPASPLPLPDHQLVLAKPSTSADEEMALLREHAITLLVCRNSGGGGSYAKIAAARALGLPVIMVQRPVS
jgi:precorrin-6A/cobalt-precorrin-6A reductase